MSDTLTYIETRHKDTFETIQKLTAKKKLEPYKGSKKFKAKNLHDFNRLANNIYKLSGNKNLKPQFEQLKKDLLKQKPRLNKKTYEALLTSKLRKMEELYTKQSGINITFDNEKSQPYNFREHTIKSAYANDVKNSFTLAAHTDMKELRKEAKKFLTNKTIEKELKKNVRAHIYNYCNKEGVSFEDLKPSDFKKIYGEVIKPIRDNLKDIVKPVKDRKTGKRVDTLKKYLDRVKQEGKQIVQEERKIANAIKENPELKKELSETQQKLKNAENKLKSLEKKSNERKEEPKYKPTENKDLLKKLEEAKKENEVSKTKQNELIKKLEKAEKENAENKRKEKERIEAEKNKNNGHNDVGRR